VSFLSASRMFVGLKREAVGSPRRHDQELRGSLVQADLQCEMISRSDLE
jgi:hypothetical protein